MNSKKLKKNETAYIEKFATMAAQTLFFKLEKEQQAAIRGHAYHYRLTFQELKGLCEMVCDFSAWDESLPMLPTSDNITQAKDEFIAQIKQRWLQLKNRPIDYSNSSPLAPIPTNKVILTEQEFSRTIMGRCPVASLKTSCCNLLTLDAVERCAFGCSYCSIQSFYNDKNEIIFDRDFKNKLAALELDPHTIYHIGTGQSSDSLLWGNRGGILEALIEFAHQHPNVILEFKSKSSNIDFLLKSNYPPNIICTWSLNPQIIIDNEEHLTAPLKERLTAAHAISSRNRLVGFHFHPIIYYRGWEEDYSQLAEQIKHRFDPRLIAMISLGTLTYIRPVIQKIRANRVKTKLLQIPLEECAGKFSYPDETKIKIMRHLYSQFSEWHQQIFFYLCMENKNVWEKIFHYSYENNEIFETAMKKNYQKKITEIESVF